MFKKYKHCFLELFIRIWKTQILEKNTIKSLHLLTFLLTLAIFSFSCKVTKLYGKIRYLESMVLWCILLKPQVCITHIL
jgi:hypothetical protein